VPYEIQAFRRREELQRDRDELDDLVEAARSRRPQECFQLRKREFDRVEVRTVRWQEPEPRADGFNRGLDFGLLVHREVVEHHDVARAKRRDEHLLDIGEKRGVVERSVKHGGRREAVDAERGDDRVRLPVPAGRVIAEAQAAPAAAIAPQ